MAEARGLFSSGAFSSIGVEAEWVEYPMQKAKSPFCRDSLSWLLPQTFRRREFFIICRGRVPQPGFTRSCAFKFSRLRTLPASVAQKT